MAIPLLLLAVLGHVLLWVAVVNRLHAVNLTRGVSHLGSMACLAAMLGIAAGYVAWFFVAGTDVLEHLRLDAVVLRPDVLLAVLYLLGCALVAVLAMARWIWRALLQPQPAILREHQSRSVRLAAGEGAVLTEEHAHHFLVHLPRNEILHLDFSDRVIELPRLPSALDGLSIVHLSDFHFTGRVGRGYFDEVVHLANQEKPDLIAVTGDLIDENRFIDWVPETVGRLRAKYGVYFVLGNHDVWCDEPRLRRVLVECGLVDLGGRAVEVSVRDRNVVLAGNELPWMAPAADLRRCPPPSSEGGPMRIVLSHSPDQLAWAQAHHVDLMLAGHTHGGQIRLPLIGPLLAPSRSGVRYASGLFYSPPTVMHVSRGISGEFPVRLNCPPEMTRLVLRGPVAE